MYFVKRLAYTMVLKTLLSCKYIPRHPGHYVETIVQIASANIKGILFHEAVLETAKLITTLDMRSRKPAGCIQQMM